MWVLVLVPALLGLSSAMVCPDGDTCVNGNTCCKNPQGEYMCCPLPDAECCSDHLHCCYERTRCDLQHRRCVNNTVSLPWMRRLPARRAPLAAQLQEKLKAVVCPDRESECPDDTTCCQLADGSWGCCLFDKAVCCEDKLHCCPEGTRCDLEHSRCVSASSLQSFPMLEKEPARRRGNASAPPLGSVSCPGGKSSCPDSYTCCLLSSGAYGCCPYAQAKCCSDRLHCCPSNTECDVEHGICKSGETASAAPLKRIAAASDDVECPDQKSSCPDQTTCCKMADGTYGCCPMPDAVCCSDHIHCCPEGTSCDVAHSACISARGETAVMAATLHAATLHAATLHAAAVPLLSPVGNGKCDESTTCPGKSTCCRTLSGGWDCCPLPQAVCCEDHLHCCPHATVCNLQAETCDDPAGFWPPVRWLAKTPAVTTTVETEKCDERTACPGRTTCCKKSSGQWACCPVPQAVCCDDREHCCPAGYACDVAARSCVKPGALVLPWSQKLPALRREPDRKACDARTSCPRETTCCFMAGSRRWGCCPLPQAVCCEDGLHCCPAGHACEPHRSACTQGPLVVVPWFSKLSARSEEPDVAVADTKCDDKSSCASGTTCCKLQTGEWGCCPLVKAVCCADREHCCPQGYTCNMQTGTCEKTLRPPVPLLRVVRPDAEASERGGDVPCDVTGEFRCSERHTCCRASASTWACCPSPQAVCCPGSQLCCPAGHSCDPAAGGCSQSSQSSQSSQLTWDALLGDRRRGAGL
ncbi:granulin b [Clinocottus analis]|uniref:granulin b n=1 Tax=Clinocottus analis TaxID=304258 RepID=UPI0035C0F9A7